MNKEAIGKKLTKLREEKGQSKAFVAMALGLPYRTYCAYEYGERIPSDQNKILLARYYGVPVESIFYADDDREKR